MPSTRTSRTHSLSTIVPLQIGAGQEPEVLRALPALRDDERPEAEGVRAQPWPRLFLRQAQPHADLPVDWDMAVNLLKTYGVVLQVVFTESTHSLPLRPA
ncbi:hypothetical protein FIBSPDRAFT_952430 [Athelia psychrophila]|uniref:Uncharacterized protein n=1 Tax=Athelia psychrophila TaxID=1759441 RepID=A0A166LE12_9AGAM|nr:hypothetical protein FIBSPDRAFT_952430 [Fibularhizoctonia sp. CBS 109695]